jgi:hypothetical protein
MGIRIVAIFLTLGAIWNVVTTFLAAATFFDLPVDAMLNPAQFAFVAIITLLVFGFVIATHLIWSFKADDITILMLRVAWGICVAVNFLTTWGGTRRFVFQDSENDFLQAGGLFVVTFLVVASTILLSKLLLAKDIRGKPFLF